MRESPALHITEDLAARGDIDLLVIEPHADVLPASLEGRATMVDFHEAAARADIMVMLVNHDQFLNLPAPRRDGLRLIDTRGVWPADALK